MTKAPTSKNAKTAVEKVEVRGVVDRVEDDKDLAFIDHLSERHLKQRPYPHHQPGDQRVVVYIRPTAASVMAA